MKKFISIVVALTATTMLLVGCGSSNSTVESGGTTSSAEAGNTSNNVQTQDEKTEVNTENASSVELGNTYTTNNDIEFSLFKVVTSGKLQAVSGSGSYYEADSGYNYVDIIINLTNNGGEDLSVSDNTTAFFESGDGTQYTDLLICVEERDDYISQYGSVKPLATSKVHIGYTLPTDITSGKAYFGFADDLYVVDYDASVDVSNKTEVSMNQEITVDDVASFELLKTNFTADVLPPNTSGYYTHYEVDDPSNDTYFVVYCNLTNYSSSAIGADDMISVKAIFDGKYEYNANMALEEKDGTGFDYANITSIDPLETRKGVFMFEVPQKVQDMDYELSIYFYGNEYSFTK